MIVRAISANRRVYKKNIKEHKKNKQLIKRTSNDVNYQFNYPITSHFCISVKNVYCIDIALVSEAGKKQLDSVSIATRKCEIMRVRQSCWHQMMHRKMFFVEVDVPSRPPSTLFVLVSFVRGFARLFY